MIATVVMLAGIGFLAVITASITATFVEKARERVMGAEDSTVARELKEISARLAALEHTRTRSGPMGADDAVHSPTPDGDGAEPRSGGRARRGWTATRALMRIAYRDPEHVAERLTLYAADRLGEASGTWAEERCWPYAACTRPPMPPRRP